MGWRFFLEGRVTGPGKKGVIRDDRRSVEAIVRLRGVVQGRFPIFFTFFK